MKRKDIEYSSTRAAGPENELTLEKLVQTYNLLLPPIDVWGDLAKKYDMHVDLGDLLILSTRDQGLLIELDLEIPTWVKFSILVSKGEIIVVRASTIFK